MSAAIHPSAERLARIVATIDSKRGGIDAALLSFTVFGAPTPAERAEALADLLELVMGWSQ